MVAKAFGLLGIGVLLGSRPHRFVCGHLFAPVLDAYFATPEHLRIGYSILKSAAIIPEEMELLRQIEGLKKSLDSQQLCVRGRLVDGMRKSRRSTTSGSYRSHVAPLLSMANSLVELSR